MQPDFPKPAPSNSVIKKKTSRINRKYGRTISISKKEATILYNQLKNQFSPHNDDYHVYRNLMKRLADFVVKK